MTTNPNSRVIEGDCRDVLRSLPADSVQTCVTSPPYFGLRDYGTGEWEGGDPACDHLGEPFRTSANINANWDGGNDVKNREKRQPFRDCCGKCGARRVDRQIGLEPTPDEFVRALVEVFREVRRVLRDDGTVWLNLGDSFHGGGYSNHRINGDEWLAAHGGDRRRSRQQDRINANPGLKPKDLLLIPAMVAQALRAPYYTGTIKDERDRVWLAAMIDAEGCMFIHKRKVGQSNGQGYVRKNDSYGAGLEVSSTDRCIVERVMQITGRGSICEQSPDLNARRKQTLYRWNLRSNECREVIREVYPHLVAKQQEARLVLGCPSSGPNAEKVHESLKAIHQGGTPDIDFPAPESMFEGGWFLRSDIVWSKKPNPMPESVTDRPTKAHEYLFLLSKRASYFYDADAIREPHAPGSIERIEAGFKDRYTDVASGGFRGSYGGPDGEKVNPDGRNKRSVWTVATRPFAGAHFATFPPKLIEPCILAGTSPKACGVCGAPWKRVVEAKPSTQGRDNWQGHHASKNGASRIGGFYDAERATVGWEASCEHDDDSGSCVVLDPFTGAGTVGVVSAWHRRSFIGIELNPEYARMARDRIAADGALGRRARPAPEASPEQGSFFDALGGES